MLTADPNHHLRYFVGLAACFIAGLLFLALLQVIPAQYRKRTIALFTFLGGAFYAVEFFLPPGHNPLTAMLPTVGKISTILQATAVGLGVISLLGLHLRSLARAKEGWGYSMVLVAAFFAMLVWGLLNDYNPGGIVLPRLAGMNAPITNNDIYVTLFYGGYASLDAAMFALIGFFIISASYRAFRIRNAEASLLMGAAVIVMLGQVTLGTAITNTLPVNGFWANFRLENLALYILDEINTPAMRGIFFGIGVGFLATSLRLWLSLERGVYFDSEL